MNTQVSLKTRVPSALARRAVAFSALSLAIGAALTLSAPNAQAFEFTNGDLTVNVDTTVSYGYSWRVASRDPGNIAKSAINPTIFLQPVPGQIAAPGRFSANSDDGNLNYDKGDAFSNALKLTSEASFTWRDSGAFIRATAFYDWENKDRRELPRLADEKVGSDIKLLDAFIYHNFSIGDRAANVRLGRQVVSWGESTFIQGGINTINPVDLSRLRVAGAELKEAFLPIDMLYGSFDLTDNLSMEALYMFEFEQIEPDPSGTYFSTNDFASLGGSYVMLGFGTTPQPVRNPDRFWDVCFGGRPSDRTDIPAALIAAGCASAVPRAPDRAAKDSGQFGLALRYFSSAINDTEFGFYYINYHSRLPVLSGIAVTNSSVTSGRYFVEYPENVRLYGISMNTQAPLGIAFQGEVTYRPNVPLQIDDVELLFAALTPLNNLIPQPGLRFGSQLGQFNPGDEIRGWERHEVSQAQFTLTKVFGPGNFLRANQISAVAEFGATKVWDLPAQSILRYEGEGTNTGGGPDVTSGALRNPQTLRAGFPTPFSWGYRLAGRADYNNAFGSAFTLSPRFAFNHDVSGTTPGPGGNFMEDRKSYTLAVEANYLNTWAVDLSYTRFFGATRFNLLHDRDFAAFSVRYSF